METAEKPNHFFQDTTRIEAFSDGVFGFALTLLVLDIHVPDRMAGETLPQTLIQQWAGFLAYLVGFFTILICWINHHYMFKFINRSSSKFVLFNGFKLLMVTTTPFVTALLAKHMQTDWGPSAIRIYALNFALMGLAMTGVWCYARAMGFIDSKIPGLLEANTRLYIFAAILSALIWLVTYISIPASLGLFVLMFLVFIFPEKMAVMIMKCGAS